MDDAIVNGMIDRLYAIVNEASWILSGLAEGSSRVGSDAGRFDRLMTVDSD